jgi:tetratricopeptide (TPR) repeat protein
MVGAFGEVLVMDWGLAREIRANEIVHEEGSPGPASEIPHDPSETVEGAILGTLAYMAPEQARGERTEIDAQTDIYALGAILYNILTGFPPQTDGSTKEILDRVRRGEFVRPSVRAPDASIPAELEAVVMKAMAAEKRDRYPDAKAFQAELQAYLDGRVLEAAHYNPLQLMAKWVGRNRKMCTGAAAVLLVAVGFFGFQKWSRFDTNRDLALTLIEKVGDVTPFTQEISAVDPDTGRERRDSPDRAEARAAAILAYSEAANALDRALDDFPGDGAMQKRRQEVGVAIGRMALGARDYLFARQTFGQLANHDFSEEKVRGLIKKVEEVRSAVLDWRRERLEAIFRDLDAGLSHPDRPRGAPLLDDLVFEVVGYRDLQTVEILCGHLDGFTKKVRKRGGNVTWQQSERDQALFICRVLGRLGFPECVDPLGEWMDVVSDPELAVAAGIALCNTRQVEAWEFLWNARSRLLDEGDFWNRIRPHVDRLPFDPKDRTVNWTAEDFRARGVHRHAQGDWAGAREDFEEAIRLDPSFMAAYFHRGVLHMVFRRYSQAIADFNRAIELGPDDSAIRTSRGTGFYYLKRYDLAILDYNRAIELDPKYHQAWIHRSATYRALRRYRKAMADLDQAIHFSPDNASLYVNRGNLFVDLKEYEKSEKEYDRAIEIDPQMALAFINRALVRVRRNKSEAAIADCSRAIRLDPRSVSAYQVRASIWKRMGKLNEADADQAMFEKLKAENRERRRRQNGRAGN